MWARTWLVKHMLDGAPTSQIIAQLYFCQCVCFPLGMALRTAQDHGTQRRKVFGV